MLQSEVIVRVTFGTGPAGTGVYVLGRQGPWSDPQEVEIWFLLLFFPLVPLARWRVSAAAGSDQPPSVEALELTLHARSRVKIVAALGRISKAAGVAALAVLPLAYGVWNIGLAWATPLLRTVLGSLLDPGVLGKLSMAVETGVVLAGAGIPVLALMLLDARTPRVPLRSMLRQP